MGLLASVVVLTLALGPMSVSANVPAVATRFRADIKGDGLSGVVKVILAHDEESGHLKWWLEGLRPGHELVIRVNAGTCRNLGALIVRHWRPVGGSTSADSVALPAGSTAAFVRHEDHVAATVTSGMRSDCAAFWVFGGYGCARACAAGAQVSAGEPRRRP